MKFRFVSFFAILLINLGTFAQPPETIYEGILIASGFRQSIPLASDGPFPIGFNFTFFGTSYSQFYVSANGLVMFTDPDGLYNTEVTIPAASTPNNYIAPFWDNLSILDGGNVLYTTVGASPNRKCIIQYKNIGFDPITTPFGTFSVILYETTNIIQIQYRLIVDPYSAKSHGESATIGLENSDGSSGVLFAYHEVDAVYSEDAISFTPSGLTYTVNPDASYDGVFLTTNTTLPDPGIVELITPSVDAVIGADQTFEWSAATNASSYNLVIDVSPDLSSATYYNAGSNLSYDITGLSLDQTYYWAVFSSNVTSMTWCEVRRFSTSSTPPLTAVPREIWVAQGDEREFKLQYTGGDASAKTAIVTSLPAQGQLYQVNGGVKSDLITTVPATVTDPQHNLIYVANGATGNGAGSFNFKFHDDTGDSPEATITINVSPPGIPNFLTAARNINVELQFDRKMNDPAGKQNQFTVTVNGTPVTISSASLKTGDPYTIILTLATPLTGTETVLVSYTKGTISATTGGLLESFTDQSVTLLAQTITFTTNLNKKYGNPPFLLSASSPSGLSFTFSSSNLAVATVNVSNVATILSVGTSDITAHQAGNATYAPARYIRTLTVTKGDQIITFNALPAKTYGDADFSPGSMVNSGLTISYASDNPAVATIVGSQIHIVGAGTAVITASQAGNTLWNPATDVNQTLTVSKANQTITFNSLPTKIYGEADFNPGATASSGLTVTYSSDNIAVATIAGELIHITGGGTAIITASQAGNTNYNAAPDVTQTLNVNKVDLTFTADNKTRGYLVTNPTLTFTILGFVNGETQSVLDVLPVIQTTALQNSPVGEYPVTISGGSDNSYNYLYVPGILTITKADQTIIFTDVPERMLIGDTYTLAATSTSGLTVLFESMNANIATMAGSVLTGVSKGSAQIRAYNNGDQNYNAAQILATVEITSSHKNIMYLFTPNNDGFNDLWEIPEMDTYGKCDVRVFNRWGKLVYSSPDYNNDWNGTWNGNNVPEGAYYFVIKTENSGTITGTVNIIR
jgi:gliding motility-associated-like protein